MIWKWNRASVVFSRCVFLFDVAAVSNFLPFSSIGGWSGSSALSGSVLAPLNTHIQRLLLRAFARREPRTVSRLGVNTKNTSAFQWMKLLFNAKIKHLRHAKKIESKVTANSGICKKITGFWEDLTFLYLLETFYKKKQFGEEKIFKLRKN